MTTPSKTIGFIGAGNMAQSIIGGLINQGWCPDRIIATAPSESTRQEVGNRFGIRTSGHNSDACHADIVCVCVKPALVKPVLTHLTPILAETQPLLISVAAGISMSCLESWGDDSLAIVRSMPNTPSLLGFGATGLFANNKVSDRQKAEVESIFNAVGISEWVDEEALIDAVIAVSGSGPAYYFLFMETMKAMGSQLGLAPEVAERLTLQTALGAAKMASEANLDVAELRRRVCSPGGTTEQAVRTFQEGGLDGLVKEAMDAAVQRAKAMAVELGK
ncbi:pyrroline-5-carboxylate reductase [Endozoicomonas sp. Mp262]|uniref:pyrroline-5-carboxylate reductase n=1 Tax=Endozoicomonas sp. Mp262 TaxID=2919499 RepID=UPI0021D9DB0A